MVDCITSWIVVLLPAYPTGCCRKGTSHSQSILHVPRIRPGNRDIVHTHHRQLYGTYVIICQVRIVCITCNKVKQAHQYTCSYVRVCMGLCFIVYAVYVVHDGEVPFLGKHLPKAPIQKKYNRRNTLTIIVGILVPIWGP